MADSHAALEQVAEPFRAAAERAAVLCDVDGTLAPIVERPEEARAPAPVRELLARLASRYALVACVSGRRAVDALRVVGVPELLYVGNHGLEVLRPEADGPTLDPALAGRETVVREFVDSLDVPSLAAASIRVEDKGPIQVFHWRGATDPARALGEAQAIARRAQGASLVPHWGRKVLEVRPLDGVDKGSAVARVVREATVELALYGGDDRTDMDAFRALRELGLTGGLREVVCVGVDSDEAPAGLAEKSDVVVEGPAGFWDLLSLLAEA